MLETVSSAGQRIRPRRYPPGLLSSVVSPGELMAWVDLSSIRWVPKPARRPGTSGAAVARIDSPAREIWDRAPLDPPWIEDQVAAIMKENATSPAATPTTRPTAIETMALGMLTM